VTQAKPRTYDLEPRFKWSISQYHEAIAAGLFQDSDVELLDEELFTMSPEGPIHSGTITLAQYYLFSAIPQDKGIIRLGNPVTLSASEPEPDIAIVRPGRYLDRHPELEDILVIIEYAHSSLPKDNDPKGKKFQTYAREGIQDYWVVDLQKMELQVNRQPDGSEYLFRPTYTNGAVQPLSLDIRLQVGRLLGR